MPNVYAYTRVSTGRQEMSLQAQERILMGYALANEWELVKTYTDENISGSTAFSSRPAGSELMGVLSPGDVLLVAKLDRIFRNSEDAITTINVLKSRKIRLFIIDLGGEVTGDGVGKLMFTVLAAFADFERGRIAERICECKVEQRGAGRYLGGRIPFGHTVTGKSGSLYLVQQEWYPGVVLDVIALHGEGKSYRAIARTVSDRGYPVSHKTIGKLLSGMLGNCNE